MMQIIRLSLISIITILFSLFLLLTTANAQSASGYHFVEVIDIAGRPVANARVEPIGSGSNETRTTNKKGVARITRNYGDYHTDGLKVSKPGYITYEDNELLRYRRYRYDRDFSEYDPKSPTKVQLLKEPTTAAEREAVEVAERKRKLIIAVKKGDNDSVAKLLKAGADANSKDEYGTPAIILATTTNTTMIKLLLSAGVKVDDKDQLASKVLLYYLQSLYEKEIAFDRELLEMLIKAGANINASNRQGLTPFYLSRLIPHNEIFELLQKAAH